MTIQDAYDLATLKLIIERRMRAYPHAEPHPETVTALAEGLLAVIDVSNARPAEYAHEPWLSQSSEEHALHSWTHGERAWQSTVSSAYPWLTDIGQPEIAHSCMRSMLCLYQHNRGK